MAADLPAPVDMIVEAEGYEPEKGERAISALLKTQPDLRGATAIFCAADNSRSVA